MTGVQFQDVCEALVEAFTDLDDLDQMLRYRLNIKRQNLVANGPLETVVFRLLEKAESRGWEIDLIQATFRHAPRNRKVATVYQKYGLAPDAMVQLAGATSIAAVKATDAGFESRVTDLKLVD